MRQLYASVTTTSGIFSIQTNGSHTAQTSTAQIECTATTLDIGSAVAVDMGYVDEHNLIFTGYVKNIELKEPSKIYSITCADVLVRAMDFFIASLDPDKPLTYNHITAESLVGNVLALAGISDYSGESTGFTFGINNPVEVNLTSSYDYARFIADILANALYADLAGQVHFERRLPYVVDGDTSVGTIAITDATTMGYSKTDRDLRNKIIVYGAEGVYAEASASSPYLPDGFYKTTVVAASTVFDNTDMAQQSADYNLELLNRLTETMSITIIGDSNFQPRQVVTVTSALSGISGDWYVFGVSHEWGSSGYLTRLELRR